MSYRGLPARLLDLLETEDGWVSRDYAALRLEAAPGSVRRALERLKALGLVESRVVELAQSVGAGATSYMGNGGGPVDRRSDWRVL